MNFIDNQHEDMPPGAAQSTPQPMIEKSIADALVARVKQLEAILTGYHTDTQCGSCKGPLEEERDRLTRLNERLAHDAEQARLIAELASHQYGWDGASNSKILSQFVASEWDRLTTELAVARGEVERLEGVIHLARIQYRGCGGRLTPTETVEAMMEVLNEATDAEGEA